MINPTNAIEIADKALKEVVPQFAALQPHVEELQRADNGESWAITFRADNPKPNNRMRGLSQVLFPYLEKVVRINLQSGDLLSIENPLYES